MTSKFRRLNILRLTIQAGDVMVCLERVAILNCSMENNHEIRGLRKIAPELMIVTLSSNDPLRRTRSEFQRSENHGRGSRRPSGGRPCNDGRGMSYEF